MAKIWAGRTAGEMNFAADEFDSSIKTDKRMYRQDIAGSCAHAEMLAHCGIISQSECESIVAGLRGILAELESGALAIDPAAEDIHSFVECELTNRIGDAGKKLHTARSRNDQVALDIKLYLRDECDTVRGHLVSLIEELAAKAEKHTNTVMPGYTHLQRAQPVSYAHYLLAYAQMFMRDLSRLKDALARMDKCPLGACALAGTGFAIDRRYSAKLLGFSAPTANSLDTVADRDFCVELAAVFALIAMHLSRFCEEIVLWAGAEFSFVTVGEGFSTGSSIMPQKKNPDIAELIRGKTGRVYGDLTALLTLLKGLPLAYNKDMQEDKEAIFDSLDTVKLCLGVFIPMLSSIEPQPANMLAAAQKGFINATDLADYLAKKGVPFRTAYKISGQIVAHCVQSGDTLETLPITEYKKFSPLFENDLYEEIDLLNCVKKRTSYGGPAPQSVKIQIEELKGFIKENS
ncbi:MAG: argininosuccinate lyase [Clostridia bacterium]|nr:argininosuccinate lyase [Clostridia bacterium]